MRTPPTCSILPAGVPSCCTAHHRVLRVSGRGERGRGRGRTRAHLEARDAALSERHDSVSLLAREGSFVRTTKVEEREREGGSASISTLPRSEPSASSESAARLGHFRACADNPN